MSESKSNVKSTKCDCKQISKSIGGIFVKHNTVNDVLLFVIVSLIIFGITVAVVKSLNQSPILHGLSWPLVLLVFSAYLNSIYLFHNYIKQSRSAELLETLVKELMKHRSLD